MTLTLDPAVYWHLRFVFSDTQRYFVTATAARDALRAAEHQQATLLRELGIDPQASTWQLDDDTFTITTPDTAPTAQVVP